MTLPSPARAESLAFIAAELEAAGHEQLRTADAQDIKAGGLFALSIATMLGYLTAVGPDVRHMTDIAAALGLLAFVYWAATSLEAIRVLRIRGYRSWPNPPEYVKMVDEQRLPSLADLARQAAEEHMKSYEHNRLILDGKATHLGRCLAFTLAQVAAALSSAVLTVIL